MIVYIMLCVLVGGFAVSSLYNRQQTIAAMLTLVLVILVFTFYGLRWFKGGALKGSQPNKNKSWPPIVNMCPDFMVTYKKGNDIFCYDVNNTYNLRTGTNPTAPLADLGVVGGIASSQGYMIRRNILQTTGPTRLSDDVKSTDTNKKWPLLVSMKNNTSTILGTTQGKWLRWEGVWDGRSLTPESAPLP